MGGTELSIVLLIAILAAIIALFVVVRGLHLPNHFNERERQRAVMRRRMLELELSQAGEKKTDAEETDGSAKQQRT